MITKEECLQKVNDYCNEKSYTTATLNDAFKDKFAEHFVKQNPDGDWSDEKLMASLKFNLNTAFSSVSTIIAERTSAFDAKENEYKRQIEELKAKMPNQGVQTPPDTPPFQLPDDIKQQLDELAKFKNEQLREAKAKEILELAKKEIRQDLHRSLEKYATEFAIETDKPSDEQAKRLTARFQEIFKDSLGNIKPLAPQQTQRREEELIESIKKVTIS